MKLIPTLLAVFLAAIATPRLALAQDSIPPSTPPVTTMSPVPSAGEWRHAYDAARERLLAGDFAEAASRFEGLMRSAPTDDDRAVAESLHDLARSWAERGLTLVTRNSLGESGLPARSVNERTTDEIAQLYLGGILYGVGTGLWLAEHTQPSSAAGVVLPMLLFSGVADGTVALLDINHPLHYGVAQAAVSGMYLGLEEGVVVSLWNQSLADQGSHWSGTAVADVIWALSTVGAVGGGVLGDRLGSTPGRAAFVGSTGLWSGVLTGFAAAAFTGSDSDRASNALLAADIGLSAGIVGGLVSASAVSPSIARVRFLDIGAIGGGLVAGGLYLAAADKNVQAQPAFGFTALGAAAGLGIAWAATSGIPQDRPEERPTTGVILQPVLQPVPGGASLGVAGLL